MSERTKTVSAVKGGPEFVRFFGPLLEALRELGDSGRPKEVIERIAATLNLSDDILNRINKNGGSRFANQVAWARFYLAKAGLIDTSQRGVWTLTESGRRSQLDHGNALRIFRDIQKTFREEEAEATTLLPAPDEAGPPPDEQAPGEDTFREEMARMLQSLSPEGFERLCQRILREVGFEEVVVMGRSGDGGIDGFGTFAD
jgi:restriction system protein